MSDTPKKLTKADAGRRGGNSTKARHGREHYVKAGKKGFLATVARHWQGDREGYLRWLRANGYLADFLALLDARPVEPGEIRVDELPDLPALDPDEAPFPGAPDHD
jgi:hypothetical protein